MNDTLFLDLFSGASGDMLLGVLLDVGLSLERSRSLLEKMDLSGYELHLERQVRHGISGVRLLVRDLAQAQPARHFSNIKRLLGESDLSTSVRETSLAVFERIARVEANIHGVELEEIHFHELGAVDSLVDIVGFIAGLEHLGVKKVYASPVPLGSGSIKVQHGLVPVPAPATLALLAEVKAPVYSHQAQTEIVTPTAAALLAELATFERPPMRVGAVGYAFGQKEFSWPNMLRAWLGKAGTGTAPDRDQVVLLECNLDDTTGEILGYTMERLFASGALDVWFTPIQMKKNRPATLLSALMPPDKVETAAQVFLSETSTLGLRVLPLERAIAERRPGTAQTPWGEVRVKEKWLEGKKLSVSPEFEDCARIAREHSIPIQCVYEAVNSSEI